MALSSVGAMERDAHAWLFMEHTYIGRTAFAKDATSFTKPLTQDQLQALTAAWEALKTTSEKPQRYCGSVAATEIDDECVDVPMLAAFAGDHSCFSADLERTVNRGWSRELIHAFVENEDEIRKASAAGNGARVISKWHAGHLEAQRIDEDYLARAKVNESHFVEARAWPSQMKESLEAYAARVSRNMAPSNAVGLYIQEHASALRHAARAECQGGTCKQPAEARAALLIESFALHFLEDAFSALHVAGVPPVEGDENGKPDKAQRVGTHDYYCEHGATFTTWSGDDTYGARGDAHMRKADKHRASGAVSQSLAQIADALLQPPAWLADCPDLGEDDVCTKENITGVPITCAPHMLDVLGRVPAPPLRDSPLPVLRNEVGVYLRFATAAGVGGGLTSAGNPVTNMQIEGSLGLGIGLSAVTTQTSDAAMWAQVGLTATGPQQRTQCFSCTDEQAVVGSRLGATFRVRLPYSILPGDSVPFGLLAATGNRTAYRRLVNAAEGGVIGRYQRLFLLGSSATFQIIAGREAAFTIYGDSTAFPAITLPDKSRLRLSSYALTLPVVEFALTRRFADTTMHHVIAKASYRQEWTTRPGAGREQTTHFLLITLGSDSGLYFMSF